MNTKQPRKPEREEEKRERGGEEKGEEVKGREGRGGVRAISNQQQPWSFFSHLLRCVTIAGRSPPDSLNTSIVMGHRLHYTQPTAGLSPHSGDTGGL